MLFAVFDVIIICYFNFFFIFDRKSLKAYNMKNTKILSGDAGLNNNGHDKIELVNCPHNCRNCKSILIDINRLFHESEQYQNDKEYQFSIISLKKAFEKTYELSEPVEQECAKLFRLTIIESLEKIHQELKKMTKGFFRRGRYKKICIMTEETLEEFKKILPAGKQRKLQNSSTPSKDKELSIHVL